MIKIVNSNSVAISAVNINNLQYLKVKIKKVMDGVSFLWNNDTLCLDLIYNTKKYFSLQKIDGKFYRYMSGYLRELDAFRWEEDGELYGSNIVAHWGFRWDEMYDNSGLELFQLVACDPGIACLTIELAGIGETFLLLQRTADALSTLQKAKSGWNL